MARSSSTPQIRSTSGGRTIRLEYRDHRDSILSLGAHALELRPRHLLSVRHFPPFARWNWILTALRTPRLAVLSRPSTRLHATRFSFFFIATSIASGPNGNERTTGSIR